jgi:hypothetical protein
MKSIIKKIIVIVILILLVCVMFSDFSQATSIENMIKDADGFLTMRR